MKLELPVYEFQIDDTIESGVKTISLVDDPAIDSFFVAFNNDKPKPKYVKLESEYEQAVLGLALKPDLPIYRINQETGEEYYGVFTKETIKKIVYKFHKELQNNNVNLQHNQRKYIDAFMFSDYIIDSDLQVQDLKAKGIPDAKIGSWVTAYKIEDPEVFQKVLNGEFKGFSVEAYLDVFISQHKNNIINNKLNKEKMKISKTLKERILSIFTELEKFTRVLVPELAFEIEYDEVGAPVNKVTVSENGEEILSPVGAGEFVTELGIIVVDESSNLVEVRDLPAEPATPVVEEPEVEEPEVPVTGTTGTTVTQQAVVEDVLVEDPNAMPTDPNVGMMPTNDLNKTLAELCPSAGEYAIEVTVDANGIITSAVVSSQKDLIPVAEEGGFSKQVKSLYNRVQELEGKMKDPITDPILTPEPVVVDFNKMSQYEKLMYKKGLKPV